MKLWLNLIYQTKKSVTHSSWPRFRLADCLSSSSRRFIFLARFSSVFFVSLSLIFCYWPLFFLSLSLSSLSLWISISFFLCVCVGCAGREWCHDPRLASRRFVFGRRSIARSISLGASQFRSISFLLFTRLGHRLIHPLVVSSVQLASPSTSESRTNQSLNARTLVSPRCSHSCNSSCSNY